MRGSSAWKFKKFRYHTNDFKQDKKQEKKQEKNEKCRARLIQMVQKIVSIEEYPWSGKRCSSDDTTEMDFRERQEVTSSHLRKQFHELNTRLRLPLDLEIELHKYRSQAIEIQE